MSKFSTVGMDDLLNAFNREIFRAERLAPKMLEAGAKVIAKAQKREAEDMIKYGKIRFLENDSRSTGELVESIAPTRVKGKGADAYIDVYPQGEDEKGVRNAEKGYHAEFGTNKMASFPWSQFANEKAMPEAVEKMQEIWNKEE